jgi:hypothetical protein
MNHISRENPLSMLTHQKISRGLVFGALILAALVAFEIFNYSTTEYSLRDLLGDLTFAGIQWSTILSIAFCGIDFAGLARLFTPEQGADEPAEVWYLFGAWILAAMMNAMLTWWGVSVAILSHAPSGNTLIGRDLIVKIAPVFVAFMVWLIRILIIGTFSVAGERIFSQASRRSTRYAGSSAPATSARRMPVPVAPVSHPVAAAPSPRSESQKPGTMAPQPIFRPSPKPATALSTPSLRSEPTYHPIGMSSGTRQREDFGNDL